MLTKFHLGVHIENCIKEIAKGNAENIFLKDNGEDMSNCAAVSMLTKERAKGYKIWSPCDNRDEDGNCAGHKK